MYALSPSGSILHPPLPKPYPHRPPKCSDCAYSPLFTKVLSNPIPFQITIFDSSSTCAFDLYLGIKTLNHVLFNFPFLFFVLIKHFNFIFNNFIVLFSFFLAILQSTPRMSQSDTKFQKSPWSPQFKHIFQGRGFFVK